MTRPSQLDFQDRNCDRKLACRALAAALCATLAAVLLVASAPRAAAQLYAGSVTGVVSDPSGAMIMGAEVTLTDAEKGFMFKTKTSEAGRYLFRSVPPGNYNLSITSSGFKDQSRSGIKVDVNQNVSVDLAMQMLGVSETVVVSTQAPILATQDAVTGQVVDRKFINDLPSLDRNLWGLAFLAPGITEIDGACKGCTANNFVSNGSRNATADILLDGVTTTNYEQNSGIRVDTYTPSVDAVEEFKVQETNFSAEFGFTGATIINMVTRSGSNGYHGSVYEFLRHYQLAANNWFSNQQGIPIAPLRHNNFGGTIGGPIVKNKTFFFFDYEGKRYTDGVGPIFYGVPSDPERAGDFGELCGGPNGPAPGGSFDINTGICSDPNGQLWDPYSGYYDPALGAARKLAPIPFNNLATYTSTVDSNHPGNMVLAGDPGGAPYRLPNGVGNLIDPVAQKLMQFFPEPNVNVGNGDYNPYINRVDAGANRSNSNQWDLKIDHRFSENTLLSGKYAHEWGSGTTFNCFGNYADPCSSGPTTGASHLFALNLTHNFNNSKLLDVTYGVSRGRGYYPGEAGAFPKGYSAVDALGEPAYMKSSGYDWFPAVSIGGNYSPAGAYNIGSNPWSFARLGQETHQLFGTFSWLRGKHDFKFGAEGRLHRLNYTQPNYAPGGTYYFDQTGTSNYDPTCDPNVSQCLPFGGDGMASTLVGAQPNDCCAQYEIPNSVASQNFETAGFFQDNWKKSERLTLNLGLRYEVIMPRTERRNELNWLDPNVESPITLNGKHLLGGERFASSRDRYSYSPSYNNWQPRFGFAYRGMQNTVIRGGYGIYFSAWRGAVAGTSGVGQQGFDEVTNLMASFQGDGATPAARMSNPYPNGPLMPPGSTLGLMNDVGYFAYGPIRSVSKKVPNEQSWSLGLQHEFKSDIVIDATYIGKKGTHLYFANANFLNHMGPEIEHYTPDQIQDLLSFVDNPFVDPNQSNATQLISDPNNPLIAYGSIQKLQLAMPFPQYMWGIAGDEPPIADSIYHALQIRAEKRLSHGLQFLVTYTFSKSIDDASLTSTNNGWLGSLASLQNPNNPKGERSLSTFDIPHVLQLSYTYELPVGRGKWIGNTMNPVLNAFVGGWRTNGIWRFNSGRPLQPALFNSQNLPTYGSQRPDLVGTPHRTSGKDSVWTQHYFTSVDGTDFLAQPAQYALGTAPRMLGAVRAPGAGNADLSLFKEFPFTFVREGMRLEYRLEAFNAFNHPQFCPPDMTLGADSFGAIYYQCNSPREVQMAFKFYW